MPKEMIRDVKTACEKLEKDFYVLNTIDASLFLYKGNVKAFVDAIAKNLNNHFETEAKNYTDGQLVNYGKQVLKMQKSFETTVKQKMLEAAKINPEEAKKAEIKETINHFGKDLI